MPKQITYVVTGAACIDNPGGGIQYAFQVDDGDTLVFPITEQAARGLRKQMDQAMSKIKTADIQVPHDLRGGGQ